MSSTTGHDVHRCLVAPSLFQQIPQLRCLPQFSPIHEVIADVCTIRINFELVWSPVWSHPGFGQQSLQSLRCVCVIVSKRNHSMHRAAFTDHMQSVHTVHLASTLASPLQPLHFFERNLDFTRRRLWCHTKVVGSCTSKAFEVLGKIPNPSRRVYVPVMMCSDVVFRVAEMHVQTSGTGLY